jgi:hypothetical protein
MSLPGFQPQPNAPVQTVATQLSSSPEAAFVASLAQKVQRSVSRVIVGKEAEIRLMLVAMLCEGHVLIEDVPGIGKTTLAKALARSLGCSFHRSSRRGADPFSARSCWPTRSIAPARAPSRLCSKPWKSGR